MSSTYFQVTNVSAREAQLVIIASVKLRYNFAQRAGLEIFLTVSDAVVRKRRVTESNATGRQEPACVR